MVIAISGKPGSGKTTACNKLSDTGEYMFLELGIIFRTILYYLKEKKLDEELLMGKINILEILNNINISYDLSPINNLIIYVNNNCYKYEDLFNVNMNMMTVKLGGIIGDNLNNKLYPLITNLSLDNDIILNARKPFSVYPELDLHIFLTANFNTRVERKAALNKMSLEDARNLLLERDLMEEKNGFFQISPNSKIIDTTNINSDETYRKIKKLIREAR